MNDLILLYYDFIATLWMLRLTRKLRSSWSCNQTPHPTLSLHAPSMCDPASKSGRCISSLTDHPRPLPTVPHFCQWQHYWPSKDQNQIGIFFIVIWCLLALDHPHIPHLQYTISITWSYHISLQRKSNVINWVQMTIESLYTKSTLNVPQGYSFISWSRGKYIREGLEGHMIDWVNLNYNMYIHGL